MPRKRQTAGGEEARKAAEEAGCVLRPMNTAGSGEAASRAFIEIPDPAPIPRSFREGNSMVAAIFSAAGLDLRVI